MRLAVFVMGERPTACPVRIYTCHTPTGLFSLTANILPAYEWEAVEMLTDTDYPDFLAKRWRERLPFVNVEQDVVPWPGAIASLIECPESWCGMTYAPEQIVGTPIASPMLGLVRFRPAFMAQLPDVWEPPWPTWGPRYWKACDSRLVVFADAHDPPLKFHQHFPAVTHAHGWRTIFGLESSL